MSEAQTLHERVAHWVDHLTHVLPAQAPIRDFVHHNTLHGFQHLSFTEALAAVHRLTGAQPYWPESRFLASYASGRIERADLLAALVEAGISEIEQPLVRGLTQGDGLLAALLAGSEPPDAAQIDWLVRERGLADDAVFAQCQALTAKSLAQPEDWRAVAAGRWQALCARVGDDLSLRSLLNALCGEDVLAGVRSILQRHLAAHLDLGMAAWRNPARAEGFFAAWRASAGLDLQWELDELPNVRDEILHLSADPLQVLVESLGGLLPEDRWFAYIERLMLEMPGWSGMFLWRDRNPAWGGDTPVAMLDLLAVRVLLERLLCEDLVRRLTGTTLSLAELQAYFAQHPAEFYVRDALQRLHLPENLQGQAAALVERTEGERFTVDWEEMAKTIAAQHAEVSDVDAWRLARLCRAAGLDAADLLTWHHDDASALLACADRLTPLKRGEIWLLAYERHYRQQMLAALAANVPRRQALQQVSAQVVMCMDDREEGTRRHLEEIAPDIETYGAAGFFGVAMYWQGLDDADKTALCPVVVKPTHLIREQPRPEAGLQMVRHARRREQRLRWREQLYQATRRRALAGPLLSSLAALPALAALTADTLAPGWFGATLQRWRSQYEGRVDSQLALTAIEKVAATPDAPQGGFTDAEQVDRVEGFLRTIGLIDSFAPLVLMFGHGSSSLNNPHRSAYDCGACSGRHGGPNARVFATMANRPAVRAGLAQRGIVIPPTCLFVAAYHNTCDDSVDWYDLDTVPEAFQGALDTLVRQVAEACRAHAAERCRRLASAPIRPTPWQGLRHVLGRANDLSQARPELGHATNAAAFIGRRSISRGLFLDRRVFLISYDPTQDAGGEIAEKILLAAGPVGAGISLEYYFSTVDNERFGCGSKITHNLTGLFGVMEGADSDLRTGLPLQMVEIHEPMRLLVVVEQEPEVLTAIVGRQPALRELIDNAWIILAAQSPSTAEIHCYRPQQGWQRWQPDTAQSLPQVARSVDWFAGESAPLPPALLFGAVS